LKQGIGVASSPTESTLTRIYSMRFGNWEELRQHLGIKPDLLSSRRQIGKGLKGQLGRFLISPLSWLESEDFRLYDTRGHIQDKVTGLHLNCTTLGCGSFIRLGLQCLPGSSVLRKEK